MTRKDPPADPPARRMRGFEPAAGLVADRIRRAGERRGFAIARLLTNWAEIVGDELARTTRPLKVGYGREGIGATLTLAVPGALAPLVEMQKTRIRDRVNACYGYAAIARIHLSQTAAAGFAEPAAAFAPPPVSPPQPPPLPPAAEAAVQGVADADLRAALARLAANILTRSKT
jgi:hypothetical protein